MLETGVAVWLVQTTETALKPTLELVAFADTVAGRSKGPTTGRSERRTLAVIEAGFESARGGRPVDLRERYPEIWDARPGD